MLSYSYVYTASVLLHTPDVLFNVILIAVHFWTTL